MRFPSRKIAVAAAALLAILAAGARYAHAYFTVDAVVSASFTANDRRTVGINTNANLPVNDQPAIAFTNGAGANQAKVLYQGKLALSGGVNSVDLNGVLADSYGSSVALVRVKAILVQNNSATNTLTVGNGTNPWVGLLTGTGTLLLPPGGFFMAATPDATGWAVVAATGDILKFAGTGTDQFTVILLGSDT